MADVEFKFDDRWFKKVIGSFGKKAFKALRVGGQRMGQKFVSALVQKRLTGRPGLKRGTGDLVRSFKHTMVGTSTQDLRLVIYSTSKYSRIHEKGGTIRPKRAKMLAIPIQEALATVGAVKGTMPRDMDLRVAVMNDKVFLVTKGKNPRPLFVLKHSVQIPKRLFMFKLWEDDFVINRKVLINALNKMIESF